MTPARQGWHTLTPARKAELLRPLAADGLSAREIAGDLSETLYGVTRNVVIAACNRAGIALGRQRTRVPSAKRGTVPAPATPEAPAPKVSIKGRLFAGGEEVPVTDVQVPSLPDRTSAPSNVVAETVCSEIAPSNDGIPITDLSDRTCRWPLWGFHERPRDGGRYCGRTTGHGPYCVRHARASIQPAAAPKRGRA